MFGIGFSELIVIGIILIIAVGPNRMPGMLKAAMKAYREFRRATRELRASTGIDEILRDEELKSMQKPLYVPPSAKKGLKPNVRALTRAERAQENPPEGVDLAEIRRAEERPEPEAAERIRAAKIAISARDEAIISAKIAAARSADPPDEGAVPQHATKPSSEREPAEAERIRASKIAAAEQARAGNKE